MSTNPQQLTQRIKAWGKELGFQQVGITDTNLSNYHDNFLNWLKENFHGEMGYMQRNIEKRCDPKKLIPGTQSIIVVRMDYLPPKAEFSLLKNPIKAFISRYATGRDYHKVLRKRLQQLAEKIQQETGNFSFRAFTDSAPVLEKPLAEKAGLGWIGKHTNLINPKAGSFFFIGTLFTDLDLTLDKPITESNCGSCTACIDVCPTGAIVAPYQLDARRCISYLTIELKSSIPEELRPLIGNRIYGCDDCQIICPWNKFTEVTRETDFYVRRKLSTASLIEVFNWSEQDFLNNTKGSAIRRIGYQQWLRNVAVALGNAPHVKTILDILRKKRNQVSDLVKEHIDWAIQQQEKIDKENLGHQYLYKIPKKRWDNF